MKKLIIIFSIAARLGAQDLRDITSVLDSQTPAAAVATGQPVLVPGQMGYVSVPSTLTLGNAQTLYGAGPFQHSGITYTGTGDIVAALSTSNGFQSLLNFSVLNVAAPVSNTTNATPAVLTSTSSPASGPVIIGGYTGTCASLNGYQTAVNVSSTTFSLTGAAGCASPTGTPYWARAADNGIDINGGGADLANTTVSGVEFNPIPWTMFGNACVKTAQGYLFRLFNNDCQMGGLTPYGITSQNTASPYQSSGPGAIEDNQLAGHNVAGVYLVGANTNWRICGNVIEAENRKGVFVDAGNPVALINICNNHFEDNSLHAADFDVYVAPQSPLSTSFPGIWGPLEVTGNLSQNPNGLGFLSLSSVRNARVVGNNCYPSGIIKIGVGAVSPYVRGNLACPVVTETLMPLQDSAAPPIFENLFDHSSLLSNAAWGYVAYPGYPTAPLTTPPDQAGSPVFDDGTPAWNLHGLNYVAQVATITTYGSTTIFTTSLPVATGFVTLSGFTGSAGCVALNALQAGTHLSSTTFSVPVNSTGFGTCGAGVVSVTPISISNGYTTASIAGRFAQAGVWAKTDAGTATGWANIYSAYAIYTGTSTSAPLLQGVALNSTEFTWVSISAATSSLDSNTFLGVSFAFSPVVGSGATTIILGKPDMCIDTLAPCLYVPTTSAPAIRGAGPLGHTTVGQLGVATAASLPVFVDDALFPSNPPVQAPTGYTGTGGLALPIGSAGTWTTAGAQNIIADASTTPGFVSGAYPGSPTGGSLGGGAIPDFPPNDLEVTIFPVMSGLTAGAANYMNLTSAGCACNLPIVAGNNPANPISKTYGPGSLIVLHFEASIGSQGAWLDVTDPGPYADIASIGALTGDGTATATTPGESVAFTLKTVNTSTSACGDSAHVCTLTANGKGLTTVDAGVAIGNLPSITTTTPCASKASPAACGAAPSGFVVIAAAASTVVVDTTVVTANSQIHIDFDSSLGTALSATCNTTPVLPTITARSAGTSFTIGVGVAPITNPACFSYTIVN